MNIESPTLKVRLELANEVGYLGRACDEVAKELIQNESAIILDAKWGRPPGKWRETGGGWGRSRLTEYEKGYLAGLKASGLDSPALAIIERLAK